MKNTFGHYQNVDWSFYVKIMQRNITTSEISQNKKKKEKEKEKDKEGNSIHEKSMNYLRLE